MKQVLQSLASGEIEIADVPPPTPLPGHIVVRTTRSLISPGTERTLRDFGRSSLIGKALQQPQRVREVLQKARTDGIAATFEAVRAKLDRPIPVGYNNVGKVIGVGPEVDGFALGDRVVSNGLHAEIVRVPVNLAARIPDGVSDDSAAFTVLGAIALNGIRLAEPGLGECAAVIGLGPIGLLAVQLLRAHGVRVFAIDTSAQRCELARRSGADALCVDRGEDVMERAREFSRGRGVDAVLICTATKSNDPVVQAAGMARKRGRVVLIGTADLKIPRDEFYNKELSFQISCSYGPGRYDPAYEEKGQDYPIGYVRWTEKRNFEAVLDSLSEGRLEVAPFISRRFPLARAGEAYASLDGGDDVIGIMLDYPETEAEAVAAPALLQRPVEATGAVRVGMIGAGNYASRRLAPAFRKAGAALTAVCSAGGISSARLGRKFGFARLSPDAEAVLAATDVDLVVIATRHDSHARLAAQALAAGKAVFVEKPLAMTDDEIASVVDAANAAAQPFLMAGFNRRFSPFVAQIRKGLAGAAAPAAIAITVNAGDLPADHWTQDRAAGGGRIVGDGCHFIDLARHLAGAPITQVQAIALGRTAAGRNPEDKALITLAFANGCAASIQYLANGHRGYPKERIEVFCGGKVWRIDNFRRLEGFGTPGLRGSLLGAQDKGQDAMAKAVVEALRDGKPAPIPFDELVEVAQRTIEADRLLRGVE